ncbi:MAG: peptide chain release factor N(5)-glutamine methyltransferase [Chthoniobacterales bacterium]|nr:peptide chain release factor N(5)-glutamine methyltransferase [Chthoniobacterales bacterium]
MDVLAVLKAATDYLAKNQIENPRLNAEYLLAHTLNLRRLDLYLIYDRPLSDAERAPLRSLIRRRVAREPLQYILGSWDFCGFPLKLDKRVLIPRPETELLVEFILKKLPASQSVRAADIGTGSGAIAIALAAKCERWEVIATDISSEALEVARENARAHSLDNRIKFICCDLLPDGEEKYDLIIANLPYVPSPLLEVVPEEVKHEPRVALDGGEDGLGILRRLISLAPSRLSDSGCLALEFGDGQEAAIESLLKAAGFRKISFHKDLVGKWRFVVAAIGLCERISFLWLMNLLVALQQVGGLP